MEWELNVLREVSSLVLLGAVQVLWLWKEREMNWVLQCFTAWSFKSVTSWLLGNLLSSFFTLGLSPPPHFPCRLEISRRDVSISHSRPLFCPRPKPFETANKKSFYERVTGSTRHIPNKTLLIIRHGQSRSQNELRRAKTEQQALLRIRLRWI